MTTKARAVATTPYSDLSGVPVTRISAGDALFREGERVPLVFLVKGAVRIERGSVVLDLVRAPGFVLDVGVLDGSPAGSSAFALRASQAVISDAIDPSLRPAIERASAELLRAREKRIDALASGSAEERLLAVLGDLARRYGARVSQGHFIAMPIRRSDLARMVGVTIETASRILARLEREGTIRSRREGIWISVVRQNA